MREFGKLHGSFWANSSLKEMSVDCRLLAIYLLTSQHTHMSGTFRLPDAYVFDDLNFDSERLRNSFETLSESGFCTRCPDTKWVWVHKFHVWNAPDNPNMRKAIVKHVGLIPSSVCFRANVCNLWGVFETVSEPLGNSPSPSPSPSLEEREKPKRKSRVKSEATLMPSDFSISVRVREWAEKNGHQRLEDHLQSFEFKCRAKGYSYADWDSAFMNAISDDWASLKAKSVSPNGSSNSVASSRPL